MEGALVERSRDRPDVSRTAGDGCGAAAFESGPLAASDSVRRSSGLGSDSDTGAFEAEFSGVAGPSESGALVTGSSSANPELWPEVVGAAPGESEGPAASGDFEDPSEVPGEFETPEELAGSDSSLVPGSIDVGPPLSSTPSAPEGSSVSGGSDGFGDDGLGDGTIVGSLSLRRSRIRPLLGVRTARR